MEIKSNHPCRGNESKVEKSRAEETNKPKRPTIAFFIFMEEFRKQYKEKHPNNKFVAAVGKAAGEKWKSFSDAEKSPYQAKVEEMMAEYQNKMQAYNINKKQQAADVSALPRALRLIAD
uniref:High mobility group B protein 3-like n=1 Tax=Nicotiana tabacum TaxID=4097 RepID=A0A1S3X0A2_TOBAC|nr:PREDICTED: high mobility group B protein 3-like [Nicotiana tabacum]